MSGLFPDQHDDDKERTHMTQDPDPARALHRLAQEAAPPSRMDVLRAAHDGLRMRRRRRVVQSLTGVATAGVVAAVAVLAPAHLGGGTADRTAAPAASSDPSHRPRPAATPTIVVETASPSCPTVPGTANAPLGADYRIVGAASFGWLPADQVNQITEGPENFNSDVGVTGDGSYHLAAHSTAHPAVAVFATVYPYQADVPGQTASLPPGCPSGSVGSIGGSGPGGKLSTYKIPAPDVNGGSAYWYSHTAGTVVDANGNATLVWQTPSGTWVSVESSSLDASTAEATIEHVADTLTVGTVALSTPLHITHMTQAAEMQPGQIVITRPVSGDSGAYNIQVALTFGTGDNAAEAGISVYPAGTNPYADNGQVSDCSTVGDWQVCASAPSNEVAALDTQLPGGLRTLLQDTVISTKTPGWSPDLITETLG